METGIENGCPELYQALFQALGNEGANEFLADLFNCWEEYRHEPMGEN